jgi:hypothetical protein
MPIPTGRKDQAIYHTILADMHRLRATALNLATIESGDMEQSLREHFTRDQTVLLGKLSEWRIHRPEIFREAEEDFKHQTE